MNDYLYAARGKCTIGNFLVHNKVGYWRIGDYVKREKPNVTGQVIGFAIGKDGRDCLVLDKGKTYLCPVEEALPVASIEDILYPLIYPPSREEAKKYADIIRDLFENGVS